MLQPTLGASSAGNSGSGGSSDVRGSSASRSSSFDADQPSVKERTGPTSTAVTSEPAAESASNGGGYLGFT